jgi:hypothetical protein
MPFKPNSGEVLPQQVIRASVSINAAASLFIIAKSQGKRHEN